jgi:hypothetical protein
MTLGETTLLLVEVFQFAMPRISNQQGCCKTDCTWQCTIYTYSHGWLAASFIQMLNFILSQSWYFKTYKVDTSNRQLNITAKWLALQLHIQDIPGSNFGQLQWPRSFMVFLSPSTQMVE